MTAEPAAKQQTSRDRQQDYAARAAKFVQTIKDMDKGRHSQLKRNAGETISTARRTAWMWSHIPAGGDYYAEMSFLVATLIPFDKPFLEDRARPASDLGATIRRFKIQRDGDKGKSARSGDSGKESIHPVDRRFNILIDSSVYGSDVSELAFRLRQILHLVLQKRDPALSIDWATLLTDLWNWRSPYKQTQKKWARSYYGWKADDNHSDDAATDAHVDETQEEDL